MYLMIACLRNNNNNNNNNNNDDNNDNNDDNNDDDNDDNDDNDDDDNDDDDDNNNRDTIKLTAAVRKYAVSWSVSWTNSGSLIELRSDRRPTKGPVRLWG